ncbi:hypothetical protein ABZ464_05475 [Streptomyces sp. NPDC005820]|uniref:hypothetical protein n=1 Tax=Streptomyces sp. NPDC005820 TaxID=3157069 RepID=UPI0033C24A61
MTFVIRDIVSFRGEALFWSAILVSVGAASPRRLDVLCQAVFSGPDSGAAVCTPRTNSVMTTAR